MNNFKEIAEKCLKKELFGHFTFRNEETMPSKRIYKLGFYKFNGWQYAYNEIGECINGPHCWDIIKFESNMNKENDKRNISITLRQAREWYNSGNDTLKTLALSSFSKEELDPYPRSWNEYLKNHPGNLVHAVAPGNLGNKLTVYGVLLTLCEEWIHIWSKEQGLEENWKPDWLDPWKSKFCICYERSSLTIRNWGSINHTLSFPTKELAQDFLNTFKSFLEQAKGLY